MNCYACIRGVCRLIPLALILLICFLGVLLWRNNHNRATPEGKQRTVVTSLQAEPSAKTAPTTLASSNGSASASIATSAAPMVLEDGKDINSIRKWAHNELEVQRMLNENSRIFRRQLVTFKETPAAVVERHRLTGEPVRQLTLPVLDGQEIQFEILRSDIQPSGLRGGFSGRILGKADSLVTLAYDQNRQAFTVLCPSEGMYLDAEAHEPGDAMVKSIDPNTYGVGPAEGGGLDFIKTDSIRN